MRLNVPFQCGRPGYLVVATLAFAAQLLGACTQSPPEATTPPNSLVSLGEDIWSTLEREGELLASQHKLRLKIFYPTEAYAKQAAGSLQAEGFQTRILPASPGGRTPVLASLHLRMSLAELKKLLAIADAQIEALEGVYDSYVLETREHQRSKPAKD